MVSEVSFQGVTIIVAILCNKTNHVIFIKRFLIWKAPCLLRQPHVQKNILYLNEWTWLSLNLNNHYWCCAPWFMSLFKYTARSSPCCRSRGIKSCLPYKNQEDSGFDAKGNCKEWHFHTPQMQTDDACIWY